MYVLPLPPARPQSTQASAPKKPTTGEPTVRTLLLLGGGWLTSAVLVNDDNLRRLQTRGDDDMYCMVDAILGEDVARLGSARLGQAPLDSFQSSHRRPSWVTKRSYAAASRNTTIAARSGSRRKKRQGGGETDSRTYVCTYVHGISAFLLCSKLVID